ncbi:MAG: hypothetical protein JWP02_567 [Acidimicrobiales bacterium]|nr:hypothetical protein [Acidimicrobiales bacterium]
MAGEVRPLNVRQQKQVERAIDEAEEHTGLQLCVYLGPVGEDARAHAESMFTQAGLHTRPAVLVLVAPELRQVEVVTAPEVRDRVPDEAAQRAVHRMTARFAEGDLTGGLIAGVAEIAEAAGAGPGGGEELPDLLQG